MSIATEQDVRDLFVDLDVNGDGLLSLSDLRAAVQDAEVDWSAAGLDLNRSLDEILNLADWDGERQLTFEQFWLLISRERAPVQVEVEHVRRVYEQINVRGDGLVDRGEIQRALLNPAVDWESLRIDRSTYDKHIFESADKDGDKRVTFEEFWEFVLENVQHRAHEQAVATSKSVSLMDISMWGGAEVADWICEIGFPQYRQCFEVNAIHGSKLLTLTMDMLPKLNIRDFDHMREIMRSLRRLKGQPEEAAETLNDHRQRTTYEPTTKALPERTLRFGTAKEFALETAAVDGSYSKPTYVFMPRI